MLKSAVAMTDGQLLDDYQLLVDGHALYLPNFFCETKDFQLLKDLAADVPLFLQLSWKNFILFSMQPLLNHHHDTYKSKD